MIKNYLAVERGNLIWVNFGRQIGSVQCGLRPAVVVSNRLNNIHSTTINVLPITSENKADIPVHVKIGKECGLPMESTVLCEQIITISKSQVKEKIGNCSYEVMRRINVAMMNQQGMLSKSFMEDLMIAMARQGQIEPSLVNQLNYYAKQNNRKVVYA